MNRVHIAMLLFAACRGGSTVELGSKAREPDPRPIRSWYLDADGDGFGNPAIAVAARAAPPGHVGNAADCDDTDPDRRPNAADIRDDGIDQDCNGVDATCADLADFAGDVLLTDEDTGTLDFICDELGGVSGTVRVQETWWTSLEPLSCLCWIGSIELVDNPRLIDASLLAEKPLVGPEARVVVEGAHLLDHLEVFAPERLTELRVQHAYPLREITVHGATHIGRLEIRQTEVDTLSGFTELRSVDEWVLESMPAPLQWRLPALESLGHLHVDRVLVESLSAVQSVRAIDHLELQGTAVTTLADLESLEELERLSLTYTPIPDLQPLRHLPSVASLQLQSIDTLQSLAGFPTSPALEELWVIEPRSRASSRSPASRRSRATCTLSTIPTWSPSPGWNRSETSTGASTSPATTPCRTSQPCTARG